MNNLVEPEKKFSLRRFLKEHSAGIYITILFHLIVLVFLLSSKLYLEVMGERPVFIDISDKYEDIVKQQKQVREVQAKETAASELEAMLNNAGVRSSHSSQAVRNAAVDASERGNQPLRDDRRTDVSQLNAEAQDVQRKLDANRQQVLTQQTGGADLPQQQLPKPKQEAYRGPSVLTYDMGGRKAMSLPVPAYQCKGGGDVTVIIDVNPQGYVVAASIQSTTSADDTCLHDAALRFARSSRFAVQSDAPAKQRGSIVYRFIAQ